MDRLEENFPPTTDPLGYLSVLIDHLRAHFEVEVLGWEAQFDGSTTADILLRVSQRVTSNGGGPGSS